MWVESCLNLITLLIDIFIFPEALPEAIETTCAKCTEKQKANIRKVVKAIQAKHPKEWDALVKKNDPSGKHRDNFDKFIQGSS